MKTAKKTTDSWNYRKKNIDIMDALILAYNSFVSDQIEDFNSSFYYDAPQNIINAFLDGVIE